MFQGVLLGRPGADSLDAGIFVIAELSGSLRVDTIDAVAQSLHTVWVMLAVASVVGLLASLFMADIRSELGSLREEEVSQGAHELQRMGDTCT